MWSVYMIIPNGCPVKISDCSTTAMTGKLSYHSYHYLYAIIMFIVICYVQPIKVLSDQNLTWFDIMSVILVDKSTVGGHACWISTHKIHNLKSLNYQSGRKKEKQLFTVSYTIFLLTDSVLPKLVSDNGDRQTIEALGLSLVHVPWCYQSLKIKVITPQEHPISYQPVSHDTPLTHFFLISLYPMILLSHTCVGRYSPHE